MVPRVMVLPLRVPLSQFLEGVAYLQRSSVAHLDLKPDNIVVQRDCEPKKKIGLRHH